jgi:hypothetical protein
MKLICDYRYRLDEIYPSPGRNVFAITVMRSFLFFLFDAPADHVVLFSKIDLSDGFWRMHVDVNDRFNFAFVVPGTTPLALAIPEVLQMGWTNSPAYFTVGTEAGCIIIYRLLQTLSHPLHQVEHPLEGKFFPVVTPSSHATAIDSQPPTDEPTNIDEDHATLLFLLRVYMDDYLKAVSIPRLSRLPADWLHTFTRATLHGIHAIFPPPAISGHVNGKDSISAKKLDRGDGQWHFQKVLLGILFDGDARTVSLPEDKARKYLSALEDALRRNFISYKAFQSLHGELQHISSILPLLRGFMTPLNRQLTRKPEPQTIGLAKLSELREILQHCVFLIHELQLRPTHIRELVSPQFPHYYGYMDSCKLGCGGVWLPATIWLTPTVWFVPYPPWLRRLLERRNQDGITNSDGEMAATLLQYMALELFRPLRFVSTYCFTDNSPTQGWHHRQAARARGAIPDRMLRTFTTRVRSLQMGPTDFDHWPGDQMLMADFASRSVDLSETEFLTQFCDRFPLPFQLGSWQLVRIPPDRSSKVISILSQQPFDIQQWTTLPGPNGPPSLLALDSQLSRPPDMTTPWNAAHCSWPLLAASGQVDSTMVARFRQRESRQHFASAPKYSSTTDIRIPVDLLEDNPI